MGARGVISCLGVQGSLSQVSAATHNSDSVLADLARDFYGYTLVKADQSLREEREWTGIWLVSSLKGAPPPLSIVPALFQGHVMRSGHSKPIVLDTMIKSFRRLWSKINSRQVENPM